MLSFNKTVYGKKNKKVVFLLTGWGNNARSYWLFAKILELQGYRCVTYAYDSNILSPNITGTIDNFMKVKEDILRQIKILKKNGGTDFIVFGTSLGTVLSFLLAKEAPEVTKMIINL